MMDSQKVAILLVLGTLLVGIGIPLVRMFISLGNPDELVWKEAALYLEGKQEHLEQMGVAFSPPPPTN